ncbi:hypothetical protein Gpo141_00009849 [Globisporangium polare]
MWTIFTDAQVDSAARQVFLPLILLINYTLLQYLLVFYWKRRREHRIRLLFTIGLVGVLCLVPFANSDDELIVGLNNASETCCVVTFLIQITVIGHDLNAKFKLKSVMVLTRVAEVLIMADTAMVFLSLIVTFRPDVMRQQLADDIPNAFENTTLAFIFFFRFYYIGLSRGWRNIVRTRKLEVLCYLLFATHEMPFVVLENATGISWEYPQALWNRVTIAGCLFLTANGKIKSSSRYNTSRVSVGRTESVAPISKRLSLVEVVRKRHSLEVVNVPKILD